MKVCPPMKLRVVDDITAFMEGVEQGAARRSRGVEGHEKRCGRESCEVVDHGRRKGSEVLGGCASCSYVEEKLRECSKKGSSRTCNPCGNIRSRSEDENKAASSKGKVRRKK